MNRRPSWMARVSPTISGIIIEERAHVRIASRAPVDRALRTFFISFSSTWGPFLTERDMTVYQRRPSVGCTLAQPVA